MAELQHIPHQGNSSIARSETRANALAARGLQDLRATEEAEQYLKRGLEFHRQQRYEDAFACFERGTQLNPNHPELLHMLGVYYRVGWGVPQDFAQSDILYRKAADHGHALSQNNLGWDYAHGPGVPQDYEQAGEWYRKAAKQGFTSAQLSLGHLYRDGKGVPQDVEQAAVWYRYAVEQGDASAQCELDLLYESVQGVPKDQAQPEFWYRKAADQGNVSAQKNLDLLQDEIREAADRRFDALMDARAEKLAEELLALQMFDPPITKSVKIAGSPVLTIPDSEKKYPDFLSWWMAVGRLKPTDPQGWSTLSGPWVMRNRVDIVDPDDWATLPEEERELIRTWTQTWPINMFYD